MKQVLIIDDDPRNIFALKAVLKAKGYSCVSATSAPEGIEHLKNEPGNFGIVLMDMMMPDMDGYEAIRHILQDSELRDIPVVAVTAQAMVGDREKCIKAGAAEYISKPVNVDTLLLMLRKFID